MEDHLGAFEYDWRQRFGCPLSDVFAGVMSWREAWSLTHELLQDGSSRVGAALAGFAYPMGREAFILADIYDLQHSAKSKKKIKPYPRPNDKKPDVRRIGKTQLGPATARAILKSKAPTRPGSGRDSRGRFIKK